MKNKDGEAPKFDHGPKAKREAKQLRLLKIAIIAIILQTVAFGVILAAIVIKPDRIITVDKDTGNLIGEYMTTAFRTNQEVIAGAKRFTQFHLSFNSASVYDDFAQALNMMTEKLRNQRIKYLKESDLARKIRMADSTCHLEFEKEQIVETKGHFSKVEMAGNLVIGDRNTIKTDTLVVRKMVPFRIVVDIKMVPVTPLNTSGIKVIDYYEYK